MPIFSEEFEGTSYTGGAWQQDRAEMMVMLYIALQQLPDQTLIASMEDIIEAQNSLFPGRALHPAKTGEIVAHRLPASGAIKLKIHFKE